MSHRYDDSSIETMTTIWHMRNKSSMYIGSVDLDADVQIFKEILDNSVDEAIVDPNRIYNIKVLFLHKGPRYQVVVIDEGRGVPCGKMKPLYTQIFTSGKYNSKAYNRLSIGTFGVGAKATVALSRRFMALSKRQDGTGKLVTEFGNIKDYQVTKPMPGSDTGTIVVYEPDKTILTMSDQFMTNPDGLQKALDLVGFMVVFKSNIKVVIHTVKELLPEKWFALPAPEQWNYLHNLSGEEIYVSPDNLTPMEYVVGKCDITGNKIWDLSLERKINPEDDKDLYGFDLHIGITNHYKSGLVASVNTNMMNDWTSSHISCLINVLKNKIVNYLDESNTELYSYFKTKYTIPIFGYIRASYKNASFGGQTKKEFKDITFASLYTAQLERMANECSDEVWESLYNVISTDLESKFLSSVDRVLRSGRSLKNVALDMIKEGSYIPCDIRNNEITELLITEGDNTGGYVKSVRDPAYQAVFKLTGKPINAITANSAALRSNAVYQDLLRLLGVGPNDTNLDRLNFSKIGLLADADPDGYHIQALLVGNLFKINPLILDSGRVFIATPPLYVLETKGNNVFLRDQHALDDMKVEMYYSYFQIDLVFPKQNVSHTLQYKEFRDFVYLTNRVGTIMEDVANKLVIDPMILEQLVHCVDYLSVGTLDCDKIKSVLGLDACHYHKIANSLLLVYGNMEVSIPLDKLTSEIKSYIIPELKRVCWESYVAMLSSKVIDKYRHLPVSFMQLYTYFRELDNKYPIRRLKGLGECTPEQLKRTCVDPTTRTYSVVRNLGDVDRIYALLGVDTTARKALITTDTNIGF